MKQTLVAIVGAAVGGTLGFYGFFWMTSHGYYGLILPGGLLGLGASFRWTRSVWMAAGFGLAALALGIFTEWRFAPFRKDDSLVFFVRHILDNDAVTLLMIAIGGALGFWVPYRRMEPPRPVSS